MKNKNNIQKITPLPEVVCLSNTQQESVSRSEKDKSCVLAEVEKIENGE